MIKSFILKDKSPFISEMRRSIKCIEIEERFDLVFHRPAGLLFSRVAIRIGLSPLYVSLLSLLSGTLAGVLFFWQNNLKLTVLASLLLILCAVFDSADGQVARLTGQTSEGGKILDGLIDTGVFFVVYLFACLHYFPDYGIWILVLGLLSGAANSAHSLIYDFYKNEVCYHYAGMDSMRNPDIEQVREKLVKEKRFLRKLRDFLYHNYVSEQYFFTMRKGRVKRRFEELRNNPETKKEFQRQYKEYFFGIMPWWALFGGTNVHRTLIMLFSLFAAFDYYLVVNLIGLSIPIAILIFIQRKVDMNFLKNFE